MGLDSARQEQWLGQDIPAGEKHPENIYARLYVSSRAAAVHRAFPQRAAL